MRDARTRTPDSAPSVKEKPSPLNWLQWCDQLAGASRQAETWLHPYDYFWLTRYCHLRPPDDKMGKRICATILKQQEEKILADPKVRRALGKLSQKQRQEVTALVFDWTVHFHEHAKWSIQPKVFETRARQSARLARLLESHRKKTQNSLDKFASGVSEFDPELGGIGVLAALRQTFEQTTAVELTMSPNDYLKIRSGIKKSSYYQMVAEDLMTLAMVQLFWLFQYGCGLSAGESEVRVALIRNHLWSDYAEPVERAIHKSEESKGCDAVRKAVARFHLPKGTSQ